MKRRVASIALLLLAGQAARTATPSRQAFFRKVSSPSNAIYLLGSIHVGSKDMYPMPKEIEQAFERSTALVVEGKAPAFVVVKLLEKRGYKVEQVALAGASR